MQRLEVSGAVRPIYGTLGVKRLSRYRSGPNVSLRETARRKFLKLRCEWNLGLDSLLVHNPAKVLTEKHSS